MTIPGPEQSAHAFPNTRARENAGVSLRYSVALTGVTC